jgi:methylmalonyl-CoA mutase
MSSSSARVTALKRAPGRIRLVTAASLFDGHDAAINIMRRILQAQGAEVVHLGHDRSVEEIATAAVQEDAHAVAISSYQGGHMEFFRFLVDRLRELGGPDIRIYGGGGGTITNEEAAELHDYGVARIFTPEDGRELGLEGMNQLILDECSRLSPDRVDDEAGRLSPTDWRAVAQRISWLEDAAEDGGPQYAAVCARLEGCRKRAPAPVVGFTGTGGSGKSSVVDELVRRFHAEFPELHIGLLLVDPTRRRSGGALLGDRIRMNAISAPQIFARSLATRQAHLALSKVVANAVRVLQAADFDLILVETAGIGQSDSEIVDLVDTSIYVMTPEYGAPSQLEKIDMLDMADFTVLNKSDRQGAADALRDVRKQWQRNRERFHDEAIPVFPTIASQWNDPGMDDFYRALRPRLTGASDDEVVLPATTVAQSAGLIPGPRQRYLAEIAECVHDWRARTEAQAERASDAGAFARALRDLGDDVPPQAQPYPVSALSESKGPVIASLRGRYNAALEDLDASARAQLVEWPALRAGYEEEKQSYEVRGRSIEVENFSTTLSDSRLPKIALPRTSDWGELTRYFRLENLPGRFPFTAGVFPFKRSGEDPARMFAGEGTPERTNRRFHFVCKGQPAHRLSTAFDSVTLYGRDPDERPDIYGKVGNSGVSICSVDDAKKLYSGFDLCAPNTSVSMTINGPAPMILAFFLNAAIDQGVEKHLRETGELEPVLAELRAKRELPTYAGELPEGNDGLGLALLGVSGDEVVDAESYARIRGEVLASVRGTVQADILKEDQAQNTCIFSTTFGLEMMGDIQEYFIENRVKNFYSVSISGYHMAEAGANPISQLAFTLANGFTFCEYYAGRGMAVDDFAPNLSFFFSNGLDAEYNVIGRVARRIWAVAMRERYGASERSQKLKYHTQTSGRSLHAQEMAFNDIRTTLQALMALQDQCNSLHTNAYDEAVTTPTEESVRRALAIQLIINRELGLSKNENPLQGAYVIDELTDLVEEAVLQEFERLSSRGGVLGAMETQYQRSKIQEESLRYESLKDSGELPIVGVNTFENPEPEKSAARELIRSDDAEKTGQLANLRAFQRRHVEASGPALEKLQQVARSGGNIFSELMETVKVASLQQISDALFEAGGRYRRSM